MKSLFLRFTKSITKALAAGITLMAISSPSMASDGRLAEIIKRDKLIVATFGTAPPFCYTDEKGKLVGFDIDIARLIAKALFGDENKVEFVVVTSEGRWPAVNSGRADIGIASTTVYPDRALRVAFTRPYVDSGMSNQVISAIEFLEVHASQSKQSANASAPKTVFTGHSRIDV